MIPPTTAVAVRENLPAMIGTYRKAVEDVRSAYATLEAAQSALQAAFLEPQGYKFATNRRDMSDVGANASDRITAQLKKDAWGVVVERMELRRLLSIKRRNELDEQIAKGKLPELTEANVMALFETSAANVNTYLEEAVHEVFDFLRPCNSTHKTNSEFELGRKVILTWQVEKGWGRGKFRPNYHREKYLTALDNVFSMIDGRGPVKSYHGALYEAITDSPDGLGSTGYFKFKCYLNGNLHLEFLRPDLVAQLNAVAGGSRLKNQGDPSYKRAHR
jgi:hypothetical protein